MAAPLKRVCRQASRYAQSTRPRAWQQHHHRTLHHASRAMAQQDSLSTYLAALDENLPSEAELSSTAHAELDQHRELREMVRLAAWEMPFLSHHAQPYMAPEKSPKAAPLRWRYTTYFSESHPASRKVVLEFHVFHLNLGAREALKLKKLAGSRYCPPRDLVKMSCESFETVAQNKRYLADTVNKLIAEAKDLESDAFEDVPLDTRHHRFKKPLHFPKEWNMTEERRAELDAERKRLMIAEGRKVEEGRMVSGAEAIESDRQIKLKQAEEPVMMEARRPLPAGKMGKKQMGQRGR